MEGAALVAAAFVIGCASADKPGQCVGASCDAGIGGNGTDDVDMAELPLPTPDLTPTGQLGFGDTCTDNSQCKSGICIETGIGGVCTDLCPDNMCPAGYGCIGVTGQIDPGTVTYVCVPNSTELCTPCQQNGECSVGGKDWCLPTPVGGHFCGRDCSKIGCPNGFTCADVSAGDMGPTSKQCVPTSGSCDCDASKAGMTVACDITTPTGVCKGTRTCNGASGWSMTCAPPSPTDSPDDDYKDDNCDGIDGDVTRGIFVAKASAAAVDAATCGTMAKPCKSIDWGISQAANAAMRYVYVQAAVYNEEVVLFNGIDVVGGYDGNWQRAARGTAGHDVVITGGFDATEGQFISVLAHGIAAQTTLWDLDVYGPNANDGAHPGFSSYAVHAYNAKLRLHRVGVFGGNGGDGRAGNVGTNAGTLTATGGMNGYVAPPSPPGPGDANEYSSSCDTTSRGRGGDAGTNSCPDDDNTNGGPGGAGGTMDTSCTCVFGACVCSNCSATAGLGGSAAATAPSGYGAGGPGGAGGDGSSQGGFAAGSGRVINGAGGGNDTRRAGFLVGNYWFAFGGGTGGLGKNGTGGGGGGGSGGDDAGIDSYGAGGGGGAAGGCRARAGGTGGQGGGGSFGVFAVSSTITTEMCSFQLGNGGAGGQGGRGGTGQNGGAGAPGGAANGDSKAGGPGGNGAHGGHSGGGGGGNGGIAYGIFSLSSTVNDSSTFTGGSAGAKGAGGPAASPAPNGANDGNAGADGYPGLSNGVGTCAASGGC
ncbi:MAG TPA: hypothetical protein VF334_17435 [Polyangia bacterium]